MVSSDFEKSFREVGIQLEPIEDKAEESELEAVDNLRDVSVQAEFIPIPKAVSNFGAQVEFGMQDFALQNEVFQEEQKLHEIIQEETKQSQNYQEDFNAEELMETNKEINLTNLRNTDLSSQ